MEWTEEQKREMYEDGVRSPHPAPSLSAQLPRPAPPSSSSASTIN